MHAQRLFDSWSLSAVPIPPRSPLYALDPIGIGSAMVESLSGYVARLAEAHSVSVGDLVGRVLSDLPNPMGTIITPAAKAFKSDAHGFRACRYTVNGLAYRAAKWVKALEVATNRQDLCCLTLLSFRFILSDHLFHRRRMWCPLCLEQWRASGQTIYEPLLWTIKAASHCPLHNQQLSSTCHRCKRKLTPLGVFSRPGYCEHCGGWLGASALRGHQSALNAPDNEDAWASGQIAGLLEKIPLIDPLSAGKSLRRTLNAYLAQVADGNVLALARFIQCPPSILQKWLDGTGVSMLESLLRISRRLNVPAASFFEPSGPTAIYMTAAKEAVLINSRRNVSPHRNATKIRQGLLAALREDSPQSLSGVARKLGYKSTERLYQADRALCHKIAARYWRSGQSHWWRKAGAARICETSRIKKILERSLESREPTSVHQISASLGYSNDGYIQQKFPKLCAAIAAKVAQVKQSRREGMRQILENALREYPAPTLSELAHRLGFSSSTVLRTHEPSLCNQLATKRRADIVKHRADLERRANAVIDQSPPPSVRTVCCRLGISLWFMTKYFPAVRREITQRYRRCTSPTKSR